MSGIRVALAVGAALTVFAAWPGGAGAQVPSGEVIFTSQGSLTHLELFALKVFTDEPIAVAPEIRPLTQDAADSESLAPAYSPDGRSIYFGSNRDDSFQVWGMGFDGSMPMPVTNQPGGASEPSPFPSGERIVYSCAVGLDVEICTSDLAGGGVAQLTNNALADNHADVSPDGQRIVWQQGSPPEVCTMDADGQNQSCLTNDPVSDTMPQWDPDGQTITWARGQPPNGNLMRMGSDGSNPTELTTGGTDSNPVPFPAMPESSVTDGVIFIRNTTNGPRLFIAGPNGEDPGPLNGQDIPAEPGGGLDVRSTDPPGLEIPEFGFSRGDKRLRVDATADEKAEVFIEAVLIFQARFAPGGSRSGATASKKKVELKQATAALEANSPAKVKLKVPRKARKALGDVAEAGKKVKVTLSATATDELGDVSEVTEKGKVKPKR
jgi:hypothetical protein